MWKKIRGQGHAYSYNMYVAANEGSLYFTLYKAANVVNAYKEARAILVIFQFDKFVLFLDVKHIFLLNCFFFRKCISIKINGIQIYLIQQNRR